MSFGRRKSTLYFLKRTRKISFLVHFLIHLATVTTRTSSDVPHSLCEFPYISIDTLVAHRCGLTFSFRGITNYTPKYQKFQSLESSRIYILFSLFLWKRVKQLVCRSSSYGGGTVQPLLYPKSQTLADSLPLVRQQICFYTV